MPKKREWKNIEKPLHILSGQLNPDINPFKIALRNALGKGVGEMRDVSGLNKALECGDQSVCSNLAAADVLEAKKKGFEAGRLVIRTKGAKYLHNVEWENQGDRVVIKSNGKAEGSYPNMFTMLNDLNMRQIDTEGKEQFSLQNDAGETLKIGQKNDFYKTEEEFINPRKASLVSLFGRAPGALKTMLGLD